MNFLRNKDDVFTVFQFPKLRMVTPEFRYSEIITDASRPNGPRWFIPEQNTSLLGVRPQLTADDGIRWIIPAGLHRADNIVHFDPKNKNGFGGATIQLPMDNGSTITLKGPWTSNPVALYNDTGVDIRNECVTFGTVSKVPIPYNNLLNTKSLLHLDTTPVIGTLDRIWKIAKRYANDLQQSVYAISSTSNGSTLFHCEPNDE